MPPLPTIVTGVMATPWMATMAMQEAEGLLSTVIEQLLVVVVA